MDRLIEACGSARGVWQARESSLSQLLAPRMRQSLLEARTKEWAFRLFESLGAPWHSLHHAAGRSLSFVPEEIYDPPATLFVRGNPDLDFSRALAVVGTRRPTRDGARAARELSAAIAAHGVAIVSRPGHGHRRHGAPGRARCRRARSSGFARRADNILPRENCALAQEILDSGGSLVSERPPGARVYASSYPARNRIISGLCPAALIVEAGHKSGAMITANLALEQSREVFAVPGSIYSEASKGTTP